MATSGNITKVVCDRGFAFIAADDGNEYFFHRNSVTAPIALDALRGSENVVFDIERSDKGPRANHVRPSA